MIYLLILPILLSLFSGCSHNSTYPKDNLEQSIIDAFLKEAQMQVLPAVVGKTLCIRIPIEESILSATGGFSEKINHLIEDAMILSFRVALSTDADIDFYKIILYDKNQPGICFTITRYILDTKRFMLGDISRGDFSNRMEMGVYFDTVALGAFLVQSLFDDFSKETSSQLIYKYLPSSISIKEMDPTFFSLLLEHDNKTNVSMKVNKLKTLSLNAQSALIYTKVTLDYDASEKETIFKPGTELEFIFKINSSLYPKPIVSIYSLQQIGSDNTLLYQGVPQPLTPYKNLSTWSQNLWDKEHAQENLPQFIGRQAATFIRTRFTEGELEKRFTVNNISAFYAPTQGENKGSFHFSLDIHKKISEETLDLSDTYYMTIIENALRAASQVIHRKYHYQNYEKLEISYPQKNKTYSFQPHMLEDFSKKRVSFQELIQLSQAPSQLM